MKKLSMELCADMMLCASRHDIPEAVDGAIYPETVSDPMNFGVLREIARDRLTPMFGQGLRVLNIYVTGLTPALLTVINLCRENGVTINTYHFDRATGNYKVLPMS